MKNMKSGNRQKRVVIVGAGPGGLASAMLLAQAGVQVTIVEKHGRVGGRTATLEQDGYRFDIGPTFFLYPRVLREIFADAGYSLDREVPMERLDPQYRLVFGSGGQMDATPSIERMEREIASLCPADAASFRGFLDRNRAKLDAFMPVLEQPFSRWRDLLRMDMLKMLPLLTPWRSVDGDLRSHFSDERVRLGFSFQSKYLGMSPFRCPSLFTILSFLEYEYGVFHPIGGCGAVTATMARLATEMGVDIRLNEGVEEVLVERGRAVGVRTGKESLPADAVVVNADFAEAMRKLLPARHRSKWTDRRISGQRYSCSTFMMYLGIEGRYDDVAHHTIYLAKNYRDNLRDIERLHKLSPDPSLYVQNASVTDPTLAPDGHSTLYVLLPVTHERGMIDWAEETPRFRDLALRQMEKIGLHDVRSRIRTERIVTPTTWASEFDLFRGATFSMAHNWTQMLHLRPHNRSEDVRGMYLVGGGTHPGSGLPVIFQSARISSRLLLEDLHIEPAWAGTRPALVDDDLMQVAS